jgi:nitrite reductase (NO-forming)
MFNRYTLLCQKLFVLLAVTSVLTGCVGQAYAIGESKLRAAEAASSTKTGQPTVTFTLKTGFAGGRLAFIGEGGNLEGQANPDLAVKPGDVVEIVLLNEDGLEHNLFIDGYEAGTPTVYQKGQEARLRFKAENEGTFSYYSTFSHQRASGMEGRLLVEEPGDGLPSAITAETSGSQATGEMAGMEMNEATVSFKLKTGFAEGRMAFIGVEGDLEGKVNPDLAVNPGDVVEITLVNDDGVQHNVELPDFGETSSDVIQKGEETKLVFKAEKEGVFPYYCAIPGHRQAGMEGKFIVGQISEVETENMPSISLAADALPGPIDRSIPELVRLDLETIEVEGRLADGTSYTYWTFNGTVPGPFVRVRVGDTVEVHLKNAASSTMMHSVDFHAVTGPGGGAVATQTMPGEETTFTFKAINPGLYVYHCATPMVAHHIANGMYGLILVEPEGGLPPVDREFYVMQGEIYTAEPLNQKGAATFSQEKLLDEAPEYFVFNGAAGALTQESPLQAQVGETVRIYFGVGGPNFTSSFHVIGEIFDRVYDQGSLTADPLTDVQTTLVPTGGATMVEFTLQVPGRYILVDHSLSRLERGLAGFLVAEGPEAKDIFDGEVTAGSGH